MSPSGDAPDDIPVLSVGSVVGGTSASATAWKRAVSSLGLHVQERRAGVESPLRVNVVFQIPGEVLDVDFSGVRTGRYSSKDKHLLVQAATPAEPPDDPRPLLLGLLADAVSAATEFARRRGLAADLPELRSIVASLSEP